MPGGEDRYHWAILTGPKIETENSRGKRFHAKQNTEFIDGQRYESWQLEERDIAMAPTAMILDRILVGKIRKPERLEDILRQIPVRGSTPGWNCVCWVKEALEMLQCCQYFCERIFETCQLDWRAVCDYALWYTQYKAARHRFDGQAPLSTYDTSRVATYNLLEDVEMTA